MLEVEIELAGAKRPGSASLERNQPVRRAQSREGGREPCRCSSGMSRSAERQQSRRVTGHATSFPVGSKLPGRIGETPCERGHTWAEETSRMRRGRGR